MAVSLLDVVFTARPGPLVAGMVESSLAGRRARVRR